MTKDTTREEAPDPANAGPEPVAAETPNKSAGGLDVALLTAYADGPVTVTRPGVEAKTFDVKDGKVRVSEEDRDWLIQTGQVAPEATE